MRPSVSKQELLELGGKPSRERGNSHGSRRATFGNRFAAARYGRDVVEHLLSLIGVLPKLSPIDRAPSDRGNGLQDEFGRVGIVWTDTASLSKVVPDDPSLRSRRPGVYRLAPSHQEVDLVEHFEEIT